MNIDQIKRVYFLGIGGIGMSALARYFQHLGCQVAGYDRTRTELTDTLQSEGIDVYYHDELSSLPRGFQQADQQTLVVFTPAIPQDLKLKGYLAQQHRLYKRSEVLGLISAKRFTIAVAGTHGKTTTSTMIAHVLKDSGYDCSAFLGGISSNYQSNVLFGENNTVVVEADEYDRSFLTLHPNIAVLTSADADHLDIYGDKAEMQRSFAEFLGRTVEGGTRIVRSGLPFQADIQYSRADGGDVQAGNIRIENGQFVFDYLEEGSVRIKDVVLGIAGLHNVENAVACICVALSLGISEEKIQVALANFRGVKRRFEFIFRSDEHVYIDDYAHHPEELKAFFKSLKTLFPQRKITAIFQPHLFSRTRDFADEFAHALDLVDELLLMQIYPAREEPIAGINSDWLAGKLQVNCSVLDNHQEVILEVQRRKPELLVTVGAGNIDRLVKPLKAFFESC